MEYTDLAKQQGAVYTSMTKQRGLDLAEEIRRTFETVDDSAGPIAFGVIPFVDNPGHWLVVLQLGLRPHDPDKQLLNVTL